MSEKLYKRMYDLTFEAGGIALKFFNQGKSSLKNDRSVLTQADTDISKLFREGLRDLVQGGDHLIIDEESNDLDDLRDAKLLKKVPYVWGIDPIDGTRMYANAIPFFAISVGVLKDLKPWMGLVYFPVMQELFGCDGNEAFFIKHPFTADAKRTVIKEIDQTISGRSILMCDDAVFKNYEWDYKDCQIMVSGCAAFDLCWPTISRGAGGIFNASFWDMAGSWPIVERAGMKLRSIQSGKVMDKLDFKYFLDGSWRVNDFFIVSSEKNFSVLQKKFSARRG